MLRCDNSAAQFHSFELSAEWGHPPGGGQFDLGSFGRNVVIDSQVLFLFLLLELERKAIEDFERGGDEKPKTMEIWQVDEIWSGFRPPAGSWT